MMRFATGWLTVGGVLLTTLPAAADVGYVCRIGDTIRRIEIRFAGDVGRPPCDVIYIKQTERPGVEETLWSATSDADFCRAKAVGLVDLLEQNRWTCSGEGSLPAEQVERQAAVPDQPAARAARAEAPPPPPERPEPAAAPAPGDDRDEAVEELDQQAALPRDGEVA
ncbi:MAG TPA: hypothetical protein VFZ01_08910, partial [Geminicoccaceae bacterium]